MWLSFLFQLAIFAVCFRYRLPSGRMAIRCKVRVRVADALLPVGRHAVCDATLRTTVCSTGCALMTVALSACATLSAGRAHQRLAERLRPLDPPPARASAPPFGTPTLFALRPVLNHKGLLLDPPVRIVASSLRLGQGTYRATSRVPGAPTARTRTRRPERGR